MSFFVSFETNIQQIYKFQDTNEMPEFRYILDFRTSFLSTKIDVQNKEYVVYDSSRIFRQAKELSAHIFGVSISDKQIELREQWADLSLSLFCHAAVAARRKEPDPCAWLAAEIPAKSGWVSEKSALQGEGQMLWL